MRSSDFIKQDWIHFTHIQKHSEVLDMQENNVNNIIVKNTIRNNVESTDNSVITFIQKQSIDVSIKKSVANDTTIENC